MAASSQAARLMVAAALAAGAVPTWAQTGTQGTGAIVVEPLPPIGDGETLAQPRFLRPPSEAPGDGRETGETAPREEPRQKEPTQDWDRSPDGRFHRAPKGVTDPAGDAPAPVVPIDPPATDLRAGAQLRELDKMTGQTKTFEIAVGESREVDRLRIELDACRSPEGNDLHGTMAFLKVWDTGHPRQDEVFSGWMFAESPSLSAIDHPRYDLWVISCTTSAEASSASRE